MEVYICAITKGPSQWDIVEVVRDTYPSMEINFKSPPKYLAYKREIGNP